MGVQKLFFLPNLNPTFHLLVQDVLVHGVLGIDWVVLAKLENESKPLVECARERVFQILGASFCLILRDGPEVGAHRDKKPCLFSVPPCHGVGSFLGGSCREGHVADGALDGHIFCVQIHVECFSTSHKHILKMRQQGGSLKMIVGFFLMKDSKRN